MANRHTQGMVEGEEEKCQELQSSHGTEEDPSLGAAAVEIAAKAAALMAVHSYSRRTCLGEGLGEAHTPVVMMMRGSVDGLE